MPRSKALLECAEPGCDKDADMKGRHCVLHFPRPVQQPCDARVGVIGDDNEPKLCGSMDTMEITPLWTTVKPGELHRCSPHMATGWLRREFGAGG